MIVPDNELSWTFARSGGPGGQNVNKVESKAILRWNVAATDALAPEVKERFMQQQAGRITTEGELVMSSQRYRDQDRNRADCLGKLEAMLDTASHPPRPRRATKPSRRAKQKRLDEKRRRSETKSARKSPE